MSTFIDVLLEIIKTTVPALIVFATVYVLAKQFLENQYKTKLLTYKQDQSSTTLPLRLAAYERLSLFCERISIPALILRMRSEEMSARDLRIAMMIAVQKEFEHNITQQVYVSDNLWRIVKIARDDVVNIINIVASQLEADASSRDYSKALYQYLEEHSDHIVLERSLMAIKEEAGLLM